MTHTEKVVDMIKWLLHKSDLTYYRIHKDTGIPKNTLARLQKGESEIHNIPLATALKLEKYYLEEMGKMEKVTFEGIEYTLTQEAYLTGTHGNPYYEASGIDADGNEVTVTWEIKDHWLDKDGILNGLLEDESEACDWDNPMSVECI
ncbi:hypothetical protein QT711_03295 [Sporosarcina saromensis]|uniref:XRE family transcriptional regulator n=1 Tax=Sporosarcina saromensis TaxID=359365 RepID=A0ABU4G7A4_9BACL|nr:hypothetical protein [Sporosarcina saromensis]MDW0112195.1 hypothetical protein [Sporosarcina saromensis]